MELIKVRNDGTHSVQDILPCGDFGVGGKEYLIRLMDFSEAYDVVEYIAVIGSVKDVCGIFRRREGNIRSIRTTNQPNSPNKP